MAEALPPAGYAADVAHPAIGLSIDVPDHWTVLDLDPGTWDVWLEAFLAQRLAGRATAGKERGPARVTLRELLRRLHGEKVFMAAILAAEVGGELISASATLAWRKLDNRGEAIPVAGLREVYARAPASPDEDLAARRVEVVELPAGGAVKLVTREPVPLPAGGRSQPVDVVQHLVPVLDTDWLAVLTATTANPVLAPGVEEVADGVAKSLAFRRPS